MGTVGDSGLGATELCLALLCCSGSAGVVPQAPGSATVASVDPIQRVQCREYQGICLSTTSDNIQSSQTIGN